MYGFRCVPREQWYDGTHGLWIYLRDSPNIKRSSVCSIHTSEPSPLSVSRPEHGPNEVSVSACFFFPLLHEGPHPVIRRTILRTRFANPQTPAAISPAPAPRTNAQSTSRGRGREARRVGELREDARVKTGGGNKVRIADPLCASKPVWNRERTPIPEVLLQTWL
jgi:hypothetical protein